MGSKIPEQTGSGSKLIKDTKTRFLVTAVNSIFTGLCG